MATRSGKILQRNLKTLAINDSFLIRNSIELIDLLHGLNYSGCGVFFQNVQDLFYSFPQQDLCSDMQRGIVAVWWRFRINAV